ncbi:hypothetical protein RI367_008232 [Sorochytrium milnesiophthora]
MTARTLSNDDLTALNPFSLLHQQLLRIVCSPQAISTAQQSYLTTLGKERFEIASSREAEVSVDAHTLEFGRQLVLNGQHTKNMKTLLIELTRRLDEWQAESGTADAGVASYNLLIVCRIYVKHLAFMASDSILMYLDDEEDGAVGNDQDCSRVVRDVVLAALHALAHAEISTVANYEMYQRLLSFTIACCSTQLYRSNADIAPASAHPFLTVMLSEKCQSIAQTLIQRLLSHITYRPLPPRPASSFVLSTLSYFLPVRPVEEAGVASPVADQSMALLLLLVNQPSQTPIYERAFAALDDAHPTSANGSKTSAPSSVRFRNLYSLLTRESSLEGTLLLYILIKRNTAFYNYTLSRTDPDVLLLPLLESLHRVATVAASQSALAEDQNALVKVYLQLLVVFVLTEDASFVESVMSIQVDAPLWLQERKASRFSLGDILAMVLIRLVMYNLNALRDLYLHSTCIAILCNMSASWRNMHSTVAMKDTDLHIYCDLVTLCLELINNILQKNMRYNPHLIYSLLHRQGTLQKFRASDQFADMLSNINAITSYFIERMKDQAMDNVDAVLHAIEDNARAWTSTDNLKAPLILACAIDSARFVFHEEDTCFEFFLPYAWSLVVRAGFMHWDPSQLPLITGFRHSYVEDVTSIDGGE